MFAQPQASSIILVPAAARYADGNNYTVPIKADNCLEGVFILEASQGAGTYTNETLDVDIVSYDKYTDDWDVIASFTQITDATTAIRELLRIPYGLGILISCKWAIANCLVGEAYTFSVTGTLK